MLFEFTSPLRVRHLWLFLFCGIRHRLRDDELLTLTVAHELDGARVFPVIFDVQVIPAQVILLIDCAVETLLILLRLGRRLRLFQILVLRRGMLLKSHGADGVVSIWHGQGIDHARDIIVRAQVLLAL